MLRIDALKAVYPQLEQCVVVTIMGAVSAELERSFKKQGIKVLTGTRVTSARPGASGVDIEAQTPDGGPTSTRCSAAAVHLPQSAVPFTRSASVRRLLQLLHFGKGFDQGKGCHVGVEGAEGTLLDAVRDYLFQQFVPATITVLV